ncbi:MAG: hypothetical protein N2439_11725, partial [Anaerolineae bacterium]|nr:hypothetical protein [Anaerolineae bacterium]
MKAARILLWCLFPRMVAAQPLTVEGPISGFAFEETSGAIRPILGLPGAAYLADPLIAGAAWASIAPGGSLALVLKDGVLYRVDGLKRLAPSWSAVESVEIAPDRAAWSDDGSVAVIYHTASGRAQLIRNAGAQVTAGEVLELGEVTALAVDRESRIIASTPDGVCLFAGQGSRLLLPGVRAAALAVTGDSVYVASSGGIWQVGDYAERARPQVVAAARDPVGIAVSRDGTRLFIADRAGRAVLVYDLASRAPITELALEFEPAMLA